MYKVFILLMMLVVGCTTTTNEIVTYRVTDYQYKHSYIMLGTPDNEIGMLVFDTATVTIINNVDSSYVEVYYTQHSNQLSVDSIKLFLKTQVNL